MFERYTEKARRAIFFARYEASNYGSPYIETEHVLLALVRENKALVARLLPEVAPEKIRAKVETHSDKVKSIPTNVDLPISNETKRVLTYAAEEAERLNHWHIGPEHLLLGLLHEEKCFAAALLKELGLDLADTRKKIEATPALWDTPTEAPRAPRVPARQTIRIHDSHWDIEYIRAAVGRCKEISWHWEKKAWKSRDIVVHGADGRLSFDLSLAQDTADFQLVKNGWSHAPCAVCRWKLSESSEPDHATGYTNGHDWLCMECFEKFFSGPDFFASTYSDIT